VFLNTHFENLSIKHALTSLAGFICNKKQVDIVRESGMAEAVVSKCFKVFRQVCIKAYNFENLRLGGRNGGVEIDESHLLKEKQQRICFGV
jgi:hypothetical protein